MRVDIDISLSILDTQRVIYMSVRIHSGNIAFVAEQIKLKPTLNLTPPRNRLETCLYEIFSLHSRSGNPNSFLRPSIVHYALRAAKIGGHFLDVEKSGRSYSSL